MAFEVRMFNWNKKHNSTKQPVDSDATTYMCVLLDNCSTTNPAIRLQFTDHTAARLATRNNYCHIPHFARYYFITDWVADGNGWIAHCTVDVLASYKSYIEKTSQYVLRSASMYNENIVDTLYPTTSTVTVETVNKSFNSLSGKYDTGVYVIGVINSYLKGVGSVCYYMFHAAGLRVLLWALFKSVDWLNLGPTDISGQLAKTLVNPLQYIVSCKLIPSFKGANIAEYFETPDKVDFGWWSFDNEFEARVIPCTSTIITEEKSISIPKHPQTDSAGTNAYLRLSPYSRYSIELPFYGRYVIDPAYIKVCTDIYIKLHTDVTTGNAMYELRAYLGGGEYRPIAKITTNIGIDIKLAQLATDLLTLGSGGITTISSMVSSATSLDLGGIITNGANGIESTIKSAIPQLSTVGGIGSVLQCGQDVRLFAEFYQIVDTDVAKLGKPLCKTVTIKDLSGYIKCADAHVGINNATKGEVDQVRDIMNEGFYYE